ncbi:hypothetical protein P691DRAFT_767971 [Macrolepiota fuliginosa MF-IS2]|uniref:Uncharacterized protein n=1 Tax=Macrolepiota fuliginosa MF-IS2 TaxID=1400762 RepID=A0A9P5WYJ3_9AGAR|nr:hypothetical protein P691DRAFT_767971 [Macrolepiota fuliginosa MF-IS2]
MPCKAKSKPASNILNNPHASPHSPNIAQCSASTSPTTSKPSTATQWFLALMNQNFQVLSQFTWADLMAICSTAGKCVQVYEDLLTINFTLVGDHTSPGTYNKQDSDAIISDTEEEEKININAVAYCLSIHGQWCEKNRHIEGDEECNTLINNLRLFAELFDLIPAPHKCPPPPPPCTRPHQDDAPIHWCPPTTPLCACLHQDGALPCPHLHTKDAPPLSPCCLTNSYPHPPPPSIPVTVATLPAAAASIPKPGPKPRPSYASAAAKNLNPAALPFVCGPPCAPVAPPAQAPRASSNP